VGSNPTISAISFSFCVKKKRKQKKNRILLDGCRQLNANHCPAACGNLMQQQKKNQLSTLNQGRSWFFFCFFKMRTISFLTFCYR